MASANTAYGAVWTVRWSSYVWIVLAGTAVVFLAMAACIVIVDPWKALPHSASIDRPMSNNNQRLLYPMLVRTKNWDSFVFGSSTAMLIDPKKLAPDSAGDLPTSHWPVAFPGSNLSTFASSCRSPLTLARSCSRWTICGVRQP